MNSKNLLLDACGTSHVAIPLCGCGCGDPLAPWEVKQHLRWKLRCTKKRKVGPREKVPCACGCGALVTTPNDWGQPVRYINGHGNKGRFGENAPAWGKGKYSHLRGVKAPCACGCGQLVEIYKRGRKLRRFIRGHQTRGRPNKRAGTGKCNSKEMIVCACGCGQLRRRFDRFGQEYAFIKGHANRGKPGPMRGRRQPLSQRQKLCHIRRKDPSWKANFPGKAILYKGVTFRSALEVRFAKGLDSLELHWRYEPCQLEYSDEEGVHHFYTPDFEVESWHKFIEIKTRMDRSAERKMKLVAQSNPMVGIETWTKKHIDAWLSSEVGPTITG